MDFSQDVVFAGAGPTGLSTAIQVKILRPETKILVYDKYEQYQRTQTLRIAAAAFKRMPKHEKLNQLCSTWGTEKAVRILDIESGLKELAQELGIEFRIEKIEDPRMLVQRHASARVIVGSDGFHSVVRREVFGDELHNDVRLQHLMQARYTTVAAAKPLNLFKWGAAQTMAGDYVDEHLGKVSEDTQTRKVTLRFFLKEELYQHITEARAKEPWSLDDERIPNELRLKVTNWTAARKEEPDDVEITSIQLSTYRSKEIVKLDPEQSRLTWALVGDALSGVPYFRSLNKGFREATELAKAIAKALTEPGEGLHPAFPAYAKYAAEKYERENGAVGLKNVTVNAAWLGPRLGRVMTPKWGLRPYIYITLGLRKGDWDASSSEFPEHFADTMFKCLPSSNSSDSSDDEE